MEKSRFRKLCEASLKTAKGGPTTVGTVEMTFSNEKESAPTPEKLFQRGASKPFLEEKRKGDGDRRMHILI